MVDLRRPKVEFTAQELRVEKNLLKDLKDAEKFGKVYPARLSEAKDNLAEFYDLVEERHRRS